MTPSSTYGQSVTFSATVAIDGATSSAITGTVAFFVANASNPSGSKVAAVTLTAASNGVVSTNLSSQLVAPSDTLFATFTPSSTLTVNLGTGYVNPQSNTLTQTVGQASTNVGISVIPGTTSQLGQTVEFVVTAKSAVTGLPVPAGTSATLLIDGNPAGSSLAVNSAGQAVFLVSSLTLLSTGVHNVTANVAGSTNFSPGTTSVSQTVAQHTIITLPTTSSLFVNGGSATGSLTATVKSTATTGGVTVDTGSVIFTVRYGLQVLFTSSAIPVSGGQAILTSIPVTKPGPYTVTASYTGAGPSLSAATPAVGTLVVVGPANKLSAATVGSLTPTTPFTINVTLLDVNGKPITDDNAGIVTLQSSAVSVPPVTLVNGVASFSIPGLSAGSYTFTFTADELPATYQLSFTVRIVGSVNIG